MAMIAIVGDFNDTPDSDPLTPLLADGSDLRDIFDHPNFRSDGHPGTYANGAKSNKIGYILLRQPCGGKFQPAASGEWEYGEAKMAPCSPTTRR